MTQQVALITGASRGIGAEAAKAFAAKGMRVALVARDGAALAALAESIGGNASWHVCDVADAAAMAAVVADVVAQHGRIDILVNNAGVIGPIGLMGACDPADFARAMAINVNGVVNGIHACLPVMLAQGGGTVLTVSSGAAKRPTEGWTAYCASKAAVVMVMQMLHLEYGAKGIRALSLSPGTVATDMQAAIRESGVNAISQLDWAVHIPASWPAQALVWMAGPDGDAHLGQELSLREDWLRKAVGLI